MQKQTKVLCSNYRTFTIDENGHSFSWGKGFIGHKEKTVIDLPKMIEINADQRIFTDMLVNNDSVILFAPIRVFNVSPPCGPSTGNTLIRITGTGITHTK